MRKHILFVLTVSCIIFSNQLANSGTLQDPGVSAMGTGDEITIPICGDDVCEADENYSNCPQDCQLPDLGTVTIRRFNNPSNNAPLGQWDACFLSKAYGIDNGSSNYAGTSPTTIPVNTSRVFSANERPDWTARKGSEVDSYGIVCMKTTQTAESAYPVTVYRYQNKANGFPLGQHDYCALSHIAGIDNGSNEGVGVINNNGVGQKTFPSSARPFWSIWRGGDVNDYEVICVDKMLSPEDLRNTTIDRKDNPPSDLGSYDLCALSKVAGIDNGANEGIGINSTIPLNSDTEISPNNRPDWWAEVGQDMDRWSTMCTHVNEIANRISGQVIDEGTDQPLAGVSVQIFKNTVHLETLTTDAGGNFITSYLPSSNDYVYKVVFSKTHYEFEPAELDNLILNHQDAVFPQPIMARTNENRISGQVIDDGTDQPLSGVSVQIFKNTIHLETLTTDAGGNFITSYLPSSSDFVYKIVFSKDHYEFEPAELDNLILNHQDAVFPQPIMARTNENRISGQVKVAGSNLPLPGVTVSIFKNNSLHETLTTDANGNFITSYLPGSSDFTYSVVFSKANYTFNPPEVNNIVLNYQDAVFPQPVMASTTSTPKPCSGTKCQQVEQN